MFKTGKHIQSNTLLFGQNCNITVLLVLCLIFGIDSRSNKGQTSNSVHEKLDMIKCPTNYLNKYGPICS
ncbi:hypothetical protein C5470_14630 [Photorhabdus stackebrandtii]|uniref:Uncharacterized protein n=1 Tax=Photorhabdus stackebrandtii TaxID=1123042 RepID=A0A7X5QNK5_9GAMM|nr:hypothetical protein [Photorhabdus stackebrandtii]